MSDKDQGNALAILDACSKIFRFVNGHSNAESFYADEKSFDATLLNFVVIGESVSRLSESLKKQNAHIPWQQIRQFRNLVAHDYFGVDAEEVWQIIEQHLPELEKNIHAILGK
ncbi:MAG: DUF86 domain-containing protein [Candidatus Kapaibacterium sp.]